MIIIASTGLHMVNFHTSLLRQRDSAVKLGLLDKTRVVKVDFTKDGVGNETVMEQHIMHVSCFSKTGGG